MMVWVWVYSAGEDAEEKFGPPSTTSKQLTTLKPKEREKYDNIFHLITTNDICRYES